MAVMSVQKMITEILCLLLVNGNSLLAKQSVRYWRALLDNLLYKAYLRIFLVIKGVITDLALPTIFRNLSLLVLLNHPITS